MIAEFLAEDHKRTNLLEIRTSKLNALTQIPCEVKSPARCTSLNHEPDPATKTSKPRICSSRYKRASRVGISRPPEALDRYSKYHLPDLPVICERRKTATKVVSFEDRTVAPLKIIKASVPSAKTLASPIVSHADAFDYMQAHFPKQTSTVVGSVPGKFSRSVESSLQRLPGEMSHYDKVSREMSSGNLSLLQSPLSLLAALALTPDKSTELGPRYGSDAGSSIPSLDFSPFRAYFQEDESAIAGATPPKTEQARGLETDTRVSAHGDQNQGHRFCIPVPNRKPVPTLSEARKQGPMPKSTLLARFDGITEAYRLLNRPSLQDCG